MDYRSVLTKAYSITINNPFLWIFGLFLSSGFNLNLLYISALLRAVSPRHIIFFERAMNSGSPVFINSALFILIPVVVIIGNWIKTVFMMQLHARLHNPIFEQQVEKCLLCVQQKKSNSWKQRFIPEAKVVWNITLASTVTIVGTSLLLLPLKILLTHYSFATSSAAIIFCIATTSILLCLASCLNIFTALFLLFYQLSFKNAVTTAVDLVVLRWRRVFEFTVLLVVMYGALVIVGSALIFISQLSLVTLFSPVQFTAHVPTTVMHSLQLCAAAAFLIWLTITNVFFNSCLIVFLMS